MLVNRIVDVVDDDINTCAKIYFFAADDLLKKPFFLATDS